MSTVREGYLRDIPHPTLNDVIKSNTYSAIKLLKTGKVYNMWHAFCIKTPDICCWEMSYWFGVAVGCLRVCIMLYKLVCVSLKRICCQTTEEKEQSIFQMLSYIGKYLSLLAFYRAVVFLIEVLNIRILSWVESFIVVSNYVCNC